MGGPGLAQSSLKQQQEDQVQQFAAEEVVQGWLRGVLHVWGGGADRAFGGGHGQASWLPAGFTSEADTITVTAGGRDQNGSERSSGNFPAHWT